MSPRNVALALCVAIPASGTVALADMIPSDHHYVSRCVKIDNLSDVSDVVLIGAIQPVFGGQGIESYVIQEDQCLHKGYKFNGFFVLWVRPTYLQQIGLDNLPIAECLRGAPPHASMGILSDEIEPVGPTVPDSNPLLSEELTYSLQVTQSGFELLLTHTESHYANEEEREIGRLTRWSGAALPEGIRLVWSPAVPGAFDGFRLRRWQDSADDEASAIEVGDGPIRCGDGDLCSFLDQQVTGGSCYYYRLTGYLDAGGTVDFWPPQQVTYTPVYESRLSLDPPRPNPSWGTVTFNIQALPEADCDLRIVDVTGAVVRHILPSPTQVPGLYRAEWDGRHEDGRSAAHGVYYAVARMGSQSASRSILLIR